MSVELALGDGYKRQFIGCGHGQVEALSPVLDDIGSGREARVVRGLHQVAGHVSGGVITENLKEHYQAVTGVAEGVSKGDFSEAGVGLLTAGAQFRVAELAKSSGRPVSPDKILGVFDAAVRNPRGGDFQYWMRVTTLAGLRVSSDAKEASAFLVRLLSEPSVQGDIRCQSPSRMREGLMLAAPSALNPLLLTCYDMSLRYGSMVERGLALLSVSQVPTKLASTSDERIRGLLKGWARQYSDALSLLLSETALREIPRPPPHLGVWKREDLQSLQKALHDSVAS
jgi:hypothetical protein